MKSNCKTAVVVALLVAAGTGRADRAVVVGINKYPQLKASAELAGCVNDASNMQAALEKRGFTVTRLTDDKATKAGILGALKTLAGQVKTGERVVFFFAGHGTKHESGRGALVVFDSGKSEESDLGADTLFETLKGLRAKCKSVTVLLDSCFSGAMSRAWNRNRRERFVIRAVAGTKDWRVEDADESKPVVFQTETVNDAKTNQWDSGGAAGICYFTAASGNEVAEEHTSAALGGKPSGIFTHFLTQLLNENVGKTTPWAPVQMAVTGKVAENTDNLQHPTLSGAFKNAPLFDPPSATPPAVAAAPKPVPIWDLYQSQQEDPTALQLSVNPNTIPVRVGNKFQLVCKAGLDGYLLVIERGVSGKVNLWFPLSGKIDDAKVGAGQQITIPSNPQKRLVNDRAGMEYGKALLFANTDAGRKLAGELLQRFRAEIGTPEGNPRLFVPGRDWAEVSFFDWYSADIAMNVLGNDQELVAAPAP